MKKSILFLLVLVVLLSATPAFAGGGIMVTIDGDYMTFEADQGFPTMIQGRTLVPLRAVFEALGATVDYKPATKSIKATKGEQLVMLTIDSKWAIVYKSEFDGTNVELDVPPTVIDGRTYVPLRFVSEALGCKVDYEDTGITQYIRITTPSRLSKFQNETINGTYVDFNKYNLVVAEDYYGDNYQTLVDNGKEIYYNKAYTDNNYMYEIAIFGGAYGVTVNSYEYMGATPVSESLGYLYNTVLLVHSSFPNDGSVDVITFTDGTGRSHKITVEDMSGDIGLILIDRD